MSREDDDEPTEFLSEEETQEMDALSNYMKRAGADAIVVIMFRNEDSKLATSVLTSGPGIEDLRGLADFLTFVAVAEIEAGHRQHPCRPDLIIKVGKNVH